MNILKTIFGFNTKNIREAAQDLGISISEEEREVPIFSRHKKSLVLKKVNVVRYSVPRRSGTVTFWEMLQRLPAYGANMPNDYLLNSSGPISEELSDELQKIAREYSEEYFEFEGTSLEIAIYWEEWGGTKKAASLHSLLERLAVL